MLKLVWVMLTGLCCMQIFFIRRPPEQNVINVLAVVAVIGT